MKCLYRHRFLEGTSKKARTIQKFVPPQTVARIISRCLSLQMPKFGVWLVKTLSCNVDLSIIFYLKHCRVMVIRRGDVTDIAWDFAQLEMNCLITYQWEIVDNMDNMPPSCYS